jgi:hypothetical protein
VACNVFYHDFTFPSLFGVVAMADADRRKVGGKYVPIKSLEASNGIPPRYFLLFELVK